MSSRCPYDVAGFTFSGLPGVVIGHNQPDRLGFTNLGPDVWTCTWRRSSTATLLVDGKARAAGRPVTEMFEVAGGDPVTITVRQTAHGPLISDASSDYSTVGATRRCPPAPASRDNGYAVALRWTALTPGRPPTPSSRSTSRPDWNEFRDAARLFEVPGAESRLRRRRRPHRLPGAGQIPIRARATAAGRCRGGTRAYEWDRLIPFDALPDVLDPKDGYVVTANQAIASRTTHTTSAARRLRLSLPADPGPASKTDDLTVDDMAKIRSTLQRAGTTPTPFLVRRGAGRLLPTAADALRDVGLHRCRLTPSAAAYFNAVWKNLLADTFDDQLPADARPEGDARWWAVVEGHAGATLTDVFWDDVDTPAVETRDDILRRRSWRRGTS